MIYYLNLFSVILWLSACMAGKSQKSGGKQVYKEDLSSVRPKYTRAEESGNNREIPKTPQVAIVPERDVTKTLNASLDTLAVKNTRLKLAQGFRVLVYTGNSSDEMKKVKLKLRTTLPDQQVYTEFKQPTFRVKAGDFFSRLEAYYVLNKITSSFPNAIVVPDQINIAQE